MVGRAERPLAQQPPRRTQLARHGVYLGGLQRFVGRQRRQDGGNAPGQHRLARAGRTDHDDIMTARRRDFERPLHVGLPLYVREVLGIRIVSRELSRRRRLHGVELPFAVQPLDHLLQTVRRQDLDSVDHGGLFAVPLRYDHPFQSRFARLGDDGQHPLHGAQGAVERQLAQKQRLLQPIVFDLLHRRQHADGNRQIKRRTLLAAGARLTTVFRPDMRRPQFSNAARIRSSLSLTALSGSPTRKSPMPLPARLTSTVTRTASIPTMAPA